MSTWAIAPALLLLAGAPAPPARGEVPLTGFWASEVGPPPIGWELGGTNARSSWLAVEEKPPGGPAQRYAVLGYDLGAPAEPHAELAREGRRTVVLGCWIALPKDHWVLNLDLDGDLSGNELALIVAEPKSEWFHYDLGLVDFQGPKTLRVDLRTRWRERGGPRANDRLEPPLWLGGLMLTERPRGARQGRLGLRTVRALPDAPQGLSALSLAWLPPFAGALATDAPPVYQAQVRNLSRDEIAGRTRWRVRSAEDVVKEATGELQVPAGGEQTLKLSLEGVPVGYHEAALTLQSGGESRTLCTPVALVPPPHLDTRHRLGAGEVFPAAVSSEDFVAWVQTIHCLGGSWTLAHLPFAPYEHPDKAAPLDAQTAILEAAAIHGVAVVGSLDDLPADLVDPTTRRVVAPLEQLVKRYEAASAVAAERLRYLVHRWCLLSLDSAFFPKTAIDPLPDPSFADFIERVRAKIAEADPDSGLIVGLRDRSLSQWTPRRLVWPAGVGFLTDRLYFATGNLGDTHRTIEELTRWKADSAMDGEFWLKCYALPQESGAWEPGRKYAEGVVRQLVEGVHALPGGHLLYATQGERPQEGGLLDRHGQTTSAGVAFAIAADVLNGIEPEGVVNTGRCKGYLFRSETGPSTALRADAVAALWPWPIDSEFTVPLEASSPVEHYGAVLRYPDLPPGATEAKLRPGANLLRGGFRLRLEEPG